MDIIDYQHIKQYCGCKVKLQDSFPFDSFLLGIEGLYHPVGDNEYFINSPSIVTKNNNVQEGKLYLLLRRQSKSLTVIKFIEAYYFDNGYKRYHLTEHFDTTFLCC